MSQRSRIGRRFDRVGFVATAVCLAGHALWTHWSVLAIWPGGSTLGPGVTSSAVTGQDVLVRLALTLGAFFAVVVLVMVPLVRRIQRAALGVGEVVRSGFQGSLPPERDDELGDVVLAFNAAARAARERLDELNRRDQVTREVLGNLAHDVRTPLATLKIGMERVLSEGPTPELRQRVLDEVAYLEALIDNLGALARLEGTALPQVRRPLDLGGLLERVTARFALLGQGRGVELHGAWPDEPVMVEGDPVGLEQAVGNLVHNAVDFARGNVAVLCFRDGPRAVVEVRDDGPGLVWTEVPRLTERNFRGDRSVSSGRPGQGLGLAIAAEVTRRHAGELILEPDPGGGSCVRVTLPAIAAMGPTLA